MAEQPPPASHRHRHPMLYKFCVGFGNSALVMTLLAPLDRVKIVMQVQAASKTISANGRYKTMSECFYRCCYEQGYLSMWRGYSASLINFFPSRLLGLGVQSLYGRWFLDGIDEKHKLRYFYTAVGSGAASGVTVLVLSYPVVLARTRLGADIGKVRTEREFTSLINCFRTLYGTDGIRGLYRGFLVAIQGIVIYRATYFGLYDMIRTSVSPQNRNFVVNWACGQSAAIISGLISYPLDTVCRQMQMQAGPNHRTYSSAWDCIGKVVSREGYRGFYRGLLPCLISGALTSTLHIILTW